MIEIVIIGQNEGKHIKNMLNSLFPYDYKRFWILDRCNDGSVIQLSNAGENYIKTPSEWKGRKTSSVRNLGLSKCDPEADVLFFDGDRFPVSGDLTALEKWDKDIALLMCEEDVRDSFKDNFQDYYRTINNGFYSCGIFFKRHAINKIIEQQGELFPTDVEQWWGVEDVLLGDLCYRLGVTADLVPGIRLNGKIEIKPIEKEGQNARLGKLKKMWE